MSSPHTILPAGRSDPTSHTLGRGVDVRPARVPLLPDQAGVPRGGLGYLLPHGDEQVRPATGLGDMVLAVNLSGRGDTEVAVNSALQGGVE